MVDTTQLQAIYTTLSSSAKITLDEQWDNNRLRGEDYANVVAQTIVSLIQTSAQLLQQQEQLEQQLPFVTAQKDMLIQQKLTEAQRTAQLEQVVSEATAKQAYNVANVQKEGIVLDKQATKLEADISLVTSQEDMLMQQKLTEAQRTAQLEQVVSEATAKQAYNVANVQKEGIVLDKQATKLEADISLVTSQEDMLIQQKLTEAQRTAQLEQVVSEATEKQAYNVANVQKQGAILDKQATKLEADTSLVTAQEDAITQQVIDNRKIKVFDGLGDTYGTNGAGGLTVSSDMWRYYFNLASDLAGGTAPTSTTVSKVS